MTTQTTAEPDFSVPGAALAYIEAHDADVRKLTGMNRGQLREAYRAELDARHIIGVSGGPRTNDELIGAILEYRFPRWKEAVEQNAERLGRQQLADVLNGLAFQLGNISDENLAAVLRLAHPAARERLRRMLTEVQ